MQLFMEAGFASWLSALLFLAGIGLVSFKRLPATPWAVAILASGVLGYGLGVRLVSRAAEGAPSLPEKVMFLSLGSSEAAANGVISGGLALILLVVGAIAARMRVPPA
ncbi:MAG: hypothetical protein IT383_13140 [Deltaproteobacteria bacterium]|nr:hypothetical protein [Deltaproteobacteria bacterium]